MNNSLLVVVIASGIAYGTPLLYGALGELLAERAGVLNLGVEGMMLIGAVMGFWAVQRFHFAAGLSLAAAVGVAALAGAAISLIHAFLVITMRASQIVSGLAITIFAGAAGLSSYLANDLNLANNPAPHQFQEVFSARMRDWPVVGPIVFGHNVLVYGSWLCVVAVWFYLSRTRPGLNARAVGEAPGAADAMGIDVTAYRYAHTLVGGAFAGVAGATFTLAITPQWIDGITGGAGWIAIALVIFAFWRPELCLVGAYFFGALQALSPELQAREIHLGPTVLWANSLPYVMTIVVLVVVSASRARRRLGAPASLACLTSAKSADPRARARRRSARPSYRRGILRDELLVERVVALARKDRRHAVAPDLLHRGEDPHLVVHEHVALGGVAPLDVLELLLLVDVHEHVALEGVPEA